MDSDHREKIISIVHSRLEILYEPPKTDISLRDQLHDRIGEFVQAIYRNPEHKELQNVYTKHGFHELKKDNAFTYIDNAWHIGDWDNISKEILNKIWDAIIRTKINKKDDVLGTVKTIMIASGMGSGEICDDQLGDLYCDIGKRLVFSTLMLDN